VKYVFKNIGSDESQLEFIQNLDEKGFNIKESGETMEFSKNGKKSILEMSENPEIWTLKTGDKFLMTKFKDYIKQQQNKLTENDIENSVFDYPLENFDKKNSNDFGDFANDKNGFNEFNEILKKSGVESVLVNKDLKPFYKKITLAFGCSFNERRQEEPKFKPTSAFLKKTYAFRLIKTKPNEKVELIENGDELLGEYYKNRNLIILNSTPIYEKYEKKNIEFFGDYKFKKENTQKIALIYLTDKFFSGLKSSKINTKDKIKTEERYLEDNIKSIINYNKKIRENKVKLHSLEKLLETGEIGFAEEIEKVQKLSFVDSVTPETNGIKITLKESYLQIRSFERGKNFGARSVYMGKINVTILPDHITITGLKTKKCEVVSSENCHPHVNTTDKPCFDSGDFCSNIYKLVANVKLSSVIQLLKIWLKECVNQQTHLPGHAFYDDRLRRGFPVFDGKEKIELNDPKRIKTGEQIKLTKHEDYEKNIKKFKDVIM